MCVLDRCRCGCIVVGCIIVTRGQEYRHSHLSAVQDEHGNCGIATGTEKLVKADCKPITEEQLVKTLGQTLGAETALSLRDVNVKCTFAANWPL